MSKTRRFLRLAVLSACLGLASPLHAADIIWIGGNAAWLDGGSTAFWNPADEPDANDVAIFNTNNSVTLGSNNSVQGLTLVNGITLSLGTFDLTVDGSVSVTGTSATSTLTVPLNAILAADSMTIGNGGRLLMNGGVVSINEETGNGVFTANSGSIISGNGTITMSDAPIAAATLFFLSGGTLTAASTASIDPFSTASATLVISIPAGLGRADLDNANSVINVNRNDTLIIAGNAHGSGDPFSSTINLGEGATFQMNSAWELDGDINIDSGGILANTIGTSAHIAGGALTQNSGTIILNQVDTLTFDAPFIMNGGTLSNGGHVLFAANATVGSAATFLMPSSVSSITVLPAVTVFFDEAAVNIDGGGFTANVVTIGAGGRLVLDMNGGSDEVLDGPLFLNGGELFVDVLDFDWGIDGPVTVGANTGTSRISGDRVTITAPITVGANATLRITVAIWDPGASLTVASGAKAQFNNDLVINGGTFSGGGTLQTDGMLHITANTTINTAAFDWGSFTPGEDPHIIDDGVTFTINSPVFGTMADPVALGGNGAGLIVNGTASWTMFDVVTLNTAGAGTATLGGSARAVLNGPVLVTGNTVITSPLTFNSSSNATISAGFLLNANTDVIYTGANILGQGSYDPGPLNTVNINGIFATTQIGVSNFNFDAGNWIVNSGAHLIVDVTNSDPDSALAVFDAASIMLNASGITVNTGAAEFVMDGTLTMSGGTDPLPTTWSGQPLDIGNDAGAGGVLIVAAGVSTINAHVDFNSDAVVTVNGALQFAPGLTVDFHTVNGAANAQFSGSGSLTFSGIVNVHEALLLNMTGGRVTLGGFDSTGDFINIDAPLVINAAIMSPFGRTNTAGVNILDIGIGGSLAVNLDNPAVEWTLNPQGVINIAGAAVADTRLAGSPININGTMNVTAFAAVTARLDIAGIINVLTAGQGLYLNGGTLLAPNVLLNGTINGPGNLRSTSGHALVGRGTINAGIAFEGDAQLLADNGILTLGGAISDVGTIGTADTDGTLTVTSPWNSSAATSVSLNGGRLSGGVITVANANGISGFGLVDAPIINNTRITAIQSHTLLLQTAANNNDWDGAGSGTLTATGGILELVDNAVFPFTGTVNITNNGTVVTTNFALDFNPGSTLTFGAGGGAYQSAGTTDIGGNVTVSATSTINIAPPGLLNIESTAVVTLNANLTLINSNINIAAGATFSGSGALIVPAGSHLITANNADMNILLQIAGTFRPGGNDTIGRTDLQALQQFPTSESFFELAGTVLTQFDRLSIPDTAIVDGYLNLDIDGFVPAAGQTFNIIAASNGVTGTYDLIEQTGTPADVFLVVNYTSRTVQVRAVAYDLWDNSDASNLWSTGNNWLDNSEPGTLDAIRFPSVIPPGSGTITLANVETGAALQVLGNYTFNGGSLSLGNHPLEINNSVLVMNSTLNVTGPLHLQSNGTLTIAPFNLITPAVHINNATLHLSGTGGALNIPIIISGDTTSWSSRLDVGANGIIVQTINPADKTAQIQTLIDQINEGFHAGAWDGHGITSSTAAENSQNYAVGLFDNALGAKTNFHGMPVDNNSLIVSLARLGDSNLDGIIDINDLGNLANNWQQSGETWSRGDFNRDGFVDINDLGILASNWQQTSVFPLTLAESALLATAVPEPASLAALAIAALLLPRRRACRRF